MKTYSNILLALCAASICALLSGCVAYKTAPQTIFDLGQPNAHLEQQRAEGLHAIGVAEPSVPSWLDNPEMYYRLTYANNQQLRPYANSQWSMPPVQLFAQQLKLQIAQAGGEVLSSTENAANVPWVMHIEADEFTQVFDSAEHSNGQIALRVSIFNGRNLLAQKSFFRRADAPTPDAAGGVNALSHASDAIIADILQWLSTLSSTK